MVQRRVLQCGLCRSIAKQSKNKNKNLPPSTITNTNDFSSWSSGILRIWQNSWSFLCLMVSITVQSRCTCCLTSLFKGQWHEHHPDTLETQGQHWLQIIMPPQSLPLQMVERLLWAQPDSVANHVTARLISINVSNAEIYANMSENFINQILTLYIHKIYKNT